MLTSGAGHLSPERDSAPRTEEEELQRRSSQRRLFELDSLRGLAALTVVIFHCRIAFYVSAPAWYVRPFSAGREAVVLFFVLSGYVLSLPYWNGRQPRYGPYLVRRAFRIYLPFAIAVLVAAVFATLYRGSQLTLTPFFAETWQTPITAHLLFNQLLMWPTGELNVAFWSLRYEMQLSLMMPLLCAVLSKKRAVLLVSVLGAALYARPALLEHLSWHYVGTTVEVTFIFAVGALLARFREHLDMLWGGMRRGRVVVLLVSLFLYYNVPSFLFRGRLAAEFGERSRLITAIGSAGIVLCVLHMARMSDALRHWIPEYLGRISYSLYLIHGVVLFALMDSFYRHMPNWALVSLILTCSVAGAHLFCVGVEEPSLRIGRRVALALDPDAARRSMGIKELVREPETCVQAVNQQTG
jgi:peptidoglycan/LPS O-acetylase OafA/YrhL